MAVRVLNILHYPLFIMALLAFRHGAFWIIAPVTFLLVMRMLTYLIKEAASLKYLLCGRLHSTHYATQLSFVCPEGRTCASNPNVHKLLLLLLVAVWRWLLFFSQNAGMFSICVANQRAYNVVIIVRWWKVHRNIHSGAYGDLLSSQWKPPLKATTNTTKMI